MGKLTVLAPVDGEPNDIYDEPGIDIWHIVNPDTDWTEHVNWITYNGPFENFSFDQAEEMLEAAGYKVAGDWTYYEETAYWEAGIERK